MTPSENRGGPIRQRRATISTRGLPTRDAFAYWQDQICARFVRLTAQSIGDGPFHGRIDHVSCGELELSKVAATSQIVRRTRTHIRQDDDEYLLASVLLDGCGRIEQDGRIAELHPGAMAFYDSTRPYELRSDKPCIHLVVKVPKRHVLDGDTRTLTARTLGADSPGMVVSTFFSSLHKASENSAVDIGIFFPHAIGLLAAAASFAAPDNSDTNAFAQTALATQQLTDYLHRHFADPRLDAPTVARACNMSRRSLYRCAGEEGIAGQLRKIRLEHAKDLLTRVSDQSISSIAIACGFPSESGFYRAFRNATGLTPGDYRRATTANSTLAPSVSNFGTPRHNEIQPVEHHVSS